MTDCIFCKISSGEIPTEVVYEDDLCMAFNDAAPAAPVHVLLVPKQHFSSLTQVDDPALLGHLLQTVNVVSAQLNIADEGFRVVVNTGKHGRQTVPHLHLHILGGRNMQWPPG